ncbi:hypothetical protein VNO78_17087 [Psophocarpus tetragonolobus]|uniref:ABC transporter domain-containing protein n=1 Tax=Psophocarpus tetragonolobus TaxID=3891 RepID=A0AAN9SIN9_PSOTE
MVMIWEDITVECRDSYGREHGKKKLLNGVSGFAEPSRIMALIGPSGCGKTTFLHSLSGKLAANVVVSGNIVINGKKQSLYSREVSYVAQEELFLGTLTVKETLTYSANMRLPSKMTKEEINKVVEETIMEMGLGDCENTRIGNWHCRGISTGEKKRLSIGLEILTQPYVLLLDEPTSGLDSASAFYVIQALCHIARNGKIVICSIHQPSSEIFNLFDDLLLLSSGETVYFGEAKMALKFFADAGFPCPTRRNPSDHFLLCINLDFDLITEVLERTQLSSATSNSTLGMRTSEIRRKLIGSYKSSKLMINARKKIQQLKHNEEQEIKRYIGSTTTWRKQLCTLTKRSFLNMTRDIGYYWLRIVFYMLVGITIGTLFFHIGTGNNSILARGKCVSFIYGFMICLSCGGLPFFIEELKVFYASVVPNVLMGLGTGTGVIIFMMMPSQIFRSLPDIPKFFWRYPMSYLSFAAWAVQVQVQR